MTCRQPFLLSQVTSIGFETQSDQHAKPYFSTIILRMSLGKFNLSSHKVLLLYGLLIQPITMSIQATHTSWTAKSYPTQTWTGPHSRESEPVVEQVPQIPITIRAVKDSQSPRSGRTLVICLDGTGDQFDNDNSNVVKLVACLKKDDANQITYYQSGIGTYNGRGGLKKGLSAGFDMAVCICILII
jgi:hypothetical protein